VFEKTEVISSIELTLIGQAHNIFFIMVRLRHRYLVGYILFDDNSDRNFDISLNDIQSSIREKMQTLLGDIGSGKYSAFTSVKYFDKTTNIFVIRTPQQSFHEAWFSLSCITTLTKINVVLSVVRVASCGRTCAKYLRVVLVKSLSKFSASDSVQNSESISAWADNELKKFEP